MEPLHDVYGEKYVAYLDVLGFEDLVKVAHEDPTKRELILEILRIVRDSTGELPSVGMRLTHFSDCVVISTNRSPHGLREMFKAIQRLASNLLGLDVLLRGGLVVGGIHHDRNFVYGKGFLDAYDFERLRAKHPMVLVCDQVVEDAENGALDLRKWLMRDENGKWFVHYLIVFAEYDPSIKLPGTVQWQTSGNNLIERVLRRLESHTGSVWEKDEWLRSYWNRTVAVRGIFAKIWS